MTPAARLNRIGKTCGKLFALGLLAACSVPTGGFDPTISARSAITLIPDAAGLGIEGTTQRIDFGRSPRGVIPVMDRERGRGQALELDECPSGVVQQIAWGDLVLSFTDERFVGWRAGDRRAGTTCAA